MAKTFTASMRQYLNEHQIDESKVLYLTIAVAHLRRILAGEKTVEFRDLSDFYIKKFFKVEGDEITGVKDFTHILFQAGYSSTSPRVLIELQDAGIKEASQVEPLSDMGKRMFAEAEVEGYTVDDEWIALALGKVCITEGI